jgi:hypothetical protein
MAPKSPAKGSSASQPGTQLIPYEAQEIRLANGAVVYVKAARSLRKGAPVPTDFSSVSATIEGVSQSVIDIWKKVKPSKATVEFGLELEGGSGTVVAMFASAKTKAHITVTLEWSAPTPKR